MLESIALLNQAGHWLVVHLAQLSLELAILAAVVLAALYALRVKSPALRHLFWCLVLAKPVATLLVASPLSLYAFLLPPMEELAAPAPVPVVLEVSPALRRPMPAMRTPPHSPPAIPQAERPSPWRRLNRYGMASILWGTMASLFALRLLFGFAYVGLLRQSAELQRHGRLAAMVREAAAALRLRRHVCIALSKVAHGPVLAGVWRPVILIPAEMWGT